MTTSPRRHGLSKSRIAAFEQCPKRLWLQVHRRALAEQDADAPQFRIGHQVGAEACRQCPGGVMVEAEPDLAAALATTRSLIDAGHAGPIFEATFEHEGVLVRVDLLLPEAGGWSILEVKSSTSAKPQHHGDLATQLWVARGAGLPIVRALIRHLDRAFVLKREGALTGLFADTDLTEQIAPLVDGRGAVVDRARAMLDGPEPAIAPGDQCATPYPCEFAAHCHARVPPGPDWPVTILPYGGGRPFLEEGIADLTRVDPGRLRTKVHQRVHQATVTGTAYHDAAAARAEMARWPYPRTWLDFETVAEAIPRWIGTSPYSQTPFQFVADVEKANGAIERVEFLSIDGRDPRRACAQALAGLPGEGAVIAWSAGFERARLRDLAALFPDIALALLNLADRTVDLLPVARSHWYHRDQRGSWSIKAVLPTIAPQLSYAGLEVKDGGMAVDAWQEAANPATPPARRVLLETALRLYCGRDVEAMRVVAGALAAG